MNDERLKSYLQGRLGKYHYPVDDTLWSSVSQSMPPRQRKRWLPLVAAAASVAVMVGIFILLTPSGGEKAEDMPATEPTGLTRHTPSASTGETIHTETRTGISADRSGPAAGTEDRIAMHAEVIRADESGTMPDIPAAGEDTIGKQGETPDAADEPETKKNPERRSYQRSSLSRPSEQRKQHEKKLSILLAVNGSGSSEERIYVDNNYPPSLTNSETPDIECYHPVYDFPLSFSLTVRKGLLGLFAIESGLSYTYLHTSEANSATDIKLHYLGIPVKGICTFYDNSRISLYTGAGGMVEKQVAGRLKNPDGDRSLVYSGLQWSVGASVGFHLKCSDRVGLFAEPGVNYFFNDGSNIPTIRKDKPFNFHFQVGLRFTTK
ncbi:MAG: porin family protein [Bacteroides sp.]|nr:porin family protein [Bacteroides sp.]